MVDHGLSANFEILRLEILRRGLAAGFIGRIAALAQHAHRDGAVEPPGIEMVEAEMIRQASRQRAFSRRRRTIDGDRDDRLSHL